MTGRNRPILLKKSGLASMAEKYASEIEILTFSRGCGTRISRSSVQKLGFHPSVFEQFGQTDFFNRIGQKRPFAHNRFLTGQRLPPFDRGLHIIPTMDARMAHC